jgi:predicted GNAT superfamily acetyltransferase
MSEPKIEIQELKAIEQFRDAVHLQQVIWGFEEIELLPVRLFVVASKIGGQSLGAYDGDRMIGFALAIPGLKTGAKTYLHSHIAGVLPEYRNYGIGRRLKLRQREDAMPRGIDLIEWTFDPLEIKNAYFNIERLGAVVRRFVRNQYGVTTSHLHGGLPTDRCIAEWWLKTERVNRIVAGEPYVRPEVTARVPVPVEIAQLRTGDAKRAKDIQAKVSDGFEENLSRGLAVIGMERSDDFGTYLFGETW